MAIHLPRRVLGPIYISRRRIRFPRLYGKPRFLRMANRVIPREYVCVLYVMCVNI